LMANLTRKPIERWLSVCEWFLIPKELRRKRLRSIRMMKIPLGSVLLATPQTSPYFGTMRDMRQSWLRVARARSMFDILNLCLS
jgi:hypothetical protein